MVDVVATVRGWGIGSLIALVVFLLAVVLLIIGHALTPTMVLVFIAALALAMLL